MTLKKIRLELAHTPEQPDGNADCGYEFVAPIDDMGQLEVGHWSPLHERCTVRRFWAGIADQHGRLVHHHDGNWAFSYAPWVGDDEPLSDFDHHMFAPGRHVSVTERDGVQRPFRIVSIEPA